MINEKVDDNSFYNETNTTLTTIPKEKNMNQQPDRYLTPQPEKPNNIQEMDYQPTPPPATVIVQETISGPGKDPCCLGCLLACFICCLVKDEPRK
ncbi:hypothetical protein BDC45DRAFT_513996 [Circinella umbellata]|nr:hypothetical protein BDC45DRAFT_513996 [Circinella umbellata]